MYVSVLFNLFVRCDMIVYRCVLFIAKPYSQLTLDLLWFCEIFNIIYLSTTSFLRNKQNDDVVASI